MKIKGIVLIVIQALVFNLYSQNLSESLGGINTNFQFYSDTIDLKVTDQIIIRRAEKSIGSDFIGDAAAGWGYGYQSFHLEFVARENLKIKYFKHPKARTISDSLELTFYDSNNTVLANYLSDISIIDSYKVHDSQFLYSIDLIDIPILFLDKTEKINLIVKRAEKY